MAGIKCIGILTSGGDAPGMNAAIRAVTRSAIYNGFAVKGIMRGYKGLVFNEIVSFKSQSVSNIIQLGGTILKTARSQEFTTTEGRKAAYDNMVAAGIDALVVIGGDGSLTGAGIFAEEYNVPIVGLPGTIDNDLGGTDSTIGYDTALNTIVEAALAERVKKEFPQYDARVTILGHIQRGGSPTAVDRILASRMGEAAIEALLDGQRNVMIGTMNGKIVYVPFAKAVKHDKGIDRKDLELVKILSI